jgi:netrin-G3 ligand
MWEKVAPIDQNGIITMYEVLYVPLETFGEAIQDQMIDVPVTNMSVLLMDLEDYVDYFISIRAYTSVGEGPYSQGMIIRTQENSKIMIYTRTEQKV